MQLLAFLLVYPLLWIISRLPFSIIYFISDGVYYLLYHIIGYRKKVVNKNLHLAFPNKSKKEILEIQKKFYYHVCDNMLEIIKTMGMTVAQMDKRFILTNEHVINEYAAQNRSTVLLAGHYASWEWLLALNTRLEPKAFGIYQKISNQYFEKLIKKIRGRFGTTLIRTVESRQVIADLVKNKQNFVLGIASDQSPMLNRARHWKEFLGVNVPIHVGGERMCKEHNLVPIFLKVRKVKRGYYSATFNVITENPRELPDYEISERFMNGLEESIYEAPEYYLWTHNRFKHMGKEDKKFD